MENSRLAMRYEELAHLRRNLYRQRSRRREAERQRQRQQFIRQLVVLGLPALLALIALIGWLAWLSMDY